MNRKIAALLGSIAASEYEFMRWVHGWRPPRWVVAWMVVASRLGGGWIWWAAALAILAFGGEKRFNALAAVSVATLASLAAFLVSKRLTGRKRPCETQPYCWATLRPPDRFSFPSGHAMAAFAIAVSIALYYPAFTAPLLFFAVSVAASRILLGMHFPSDVVVGILAGTGIALASSALVG